jgi:serine acetyltransferase
MKKSILRRLINRMLHSLARSLPGAKTLRPALHRLRGVKIGKNVFIGDEVYIENEYPEAVEIQDDVQLSLRTVILAHTRGPGKVVIEKETFIGANTVIAAAGGRTVRIGEGAVIGPCLAISKDVAAHIFMANESAKPVARATVPLAKAETIEQFIRGLEPIKSQAVTGSRQAESRAPQQT